MATLVDEILSLEKSADAVVAEAHAHAKKAEQDTDSALAEYRREKAEEVRRRMDAFAKSAEEKHQKALADKQEKVNAGLAAMDRIPEAERQRQVNRVISRFREW